MDVESESLTSVNLFLILQFLPHRVIVRVKQIHMFATCFVNFIIVLDKEKTETNDLSRLFNWLLASEKAYDSYI